MSQNIPSQDTENNPSFYAIIPANVRYCKGLESGAKLLYGEITALSNAMGYCWASNEYFSNLYDVESRTIQRWIKSLTDLKFIFPVIENQGFKCYRKIFISEEIQICYTHDKNVTLGTTKMSPSARQKCHPINTISINTENIIIADPDPDIESKDMPAGGNNNSFGSMDKKEDIPKVEQKPVKCQRRDQPIVHACLSSCEDLTQSQKTQLSRYQEDIVIKAVKYAYHPKIKLSGDNARIKQMFAFCNNPEAYDKTLNDLDKPKEIPQTFKEKILCTFKVGEKYNGFEFFADELGVGFYWRNGLGTYSLKWPFNPNDKNWQDEWAALVAKLKAAPKE